jgi:DNA invertase Pin-like site-specific DNA recombinase
MTAKKIAAVAYYRTSSAANVGADKDSQRRQADAVEAYAKGRYEVVASFYDAAVSGADPVSSRPGFADMLAYCENNGVAVVLVENATRFARDLMVQQVGHRLLKGKGIELIPVDMPSHFTDETPTAILIQQVMGAISEFEKAMVVAKLKHARDAKRAATGRCEGRKPVPEVVVKEARRLARKSPVTGKRRSLRAIAAELAALGHVGPAGAPYHAGSVARMLDA